MTQAQQDRADAICRDLDTAYQRAMTAMLAECGPDGMRQLVACSEANTALVTTQARRARDWAEASRN